MNRLVDFVKIVENNTECVILEVTGKPIDLIKLGCFDGNETMFRLTKGDDHTCTVWSDKGKPCSWYWGRSGYTLVSNKLDKMGKLIQECIEQDFEIYIGSNIELINKTLHIKSLKDTEHIKHTMKLMYWKENGEVCCHIDGEYFARFTNINKAIHHFENRHYIVTNTENYVAPTGCTVRVYKIAKRL